MRLVSKCDDANSLVAGQFAHLPSLDSVSNLPYGLQGEGYIYCEGVSNGYRVEHLVCFPGTPIYSRMYIFNMWYPWVQVDIL